ncbi:MAG: cob(I)yrinic acid a,c-diamide adenosyltransferase [Cyanobacteriota bacterium]|nr:cob(I)yrinic acid a,c-diamide adenosyltransferase [Cyanobacteriota bacterium]
MTASLSSSLSGGPGHSRKPQRGLHAVPQPAAAPVLRLVAQPEGLLQVHTAPFRGSVPTVLSQALRAAGLGSRVLIGQFLKGGVDQGVGRAPTLCGRLQWMRPAMAVCVDGPAAADDAAALAQRQAIVEVWHHCREQLLAGAVDLMVLDELGLAIAYGYLDLETVLATLEQRPAQMDVILTGPAMPDSLMAMADQVTQLRRGF